MENRDAWHDICITLPYNFSIYSKTILQIIFFAGTDTKQLQNGLQSRFTVKRFCKPFFLPAQIQNSYKTACKAVLQ